MLKFILKLKPVAGLLFIFITLSYSQYAYANSEVKRINLSSQDQETNGTTSTAEISGNGRYVVFSSAGDNLVANDNNAVMDVFIRDRDADGNGILDETGGVETKRLSVANSGEETNIPSGYPSVSRDGQQVVFAGPATLADPNGFPFPFRCYAYDQSSGTHKVISVSASGEINNQNCLESSASATGRYVAFATPSSNLTANPTSSYVQIFVVDRDTDEDGIFDEAGAISTHLVTKNLSGNGSNGDSSLPKISDNGRFITYLSFSTDLTEDEHNAYKFVYLHDRDADGNGIFDEENGTTTEIASLDYNGQIPLGQFSGQPDVDNSGRYITFRSDYALLTPDSLHGMNIYVRDRQLGTTKLVNYLNGGMNNDPSFPASMSSDGRFITFSSYAELIPEAYTTSNVYLYDQQEDQLSVLPMGLAGEEPNSYTAHARISDDGKEIIFIHDASNLVENDLNGYQDIFAIANPAANNCGNGQLDEGEQCDDSNSTDGDGCNTTCQIEAGYICVNESSTCLGGALLYYKFDEDPSDNGSVYHVEDASGNNKTAEVDTYNLATGRVGNSFLFTSQSDVLTVLGDWVPQDKGSASFWMHTQASGVRQRMLGLHDAYEAMLNKQSKPSNQFYRAGSVSNPGKIQKDQWYHVVMTWDVEMDLVQTYIDGELVYANGFGSNLFEGPFQHTKLKIGNRRGKPASNIFRGCLDEVALWETVLSEGDINLLMSEGNNEALCENL